MIKQYIDNVRNLVCVLLLLLSIGAIVVVPVLLYLWLPSPYGSIAATAFLIFGSPAIVTAYCLAECKERIAESEAYGAARTKELGEVLVRANELNAENRRPHEALSRILEFKDNSDQMFQVALEALKTDAGEEESNGN